MANSDKENDEWDAFLESVDRKDCPNLSPYLNAKAARESAKESFLKALEECEAGLRRSMVDELLNCTAVSIHQDQGDRCEDLEQDIIHCARGWTSEGG